MKNIHVLPTDKATRLFIADGKLFNYHKPQQGDGVKIINQNIYITSDEEIKEGDWVITPTNDIIQWAKVFQPDGKKIILTTDQDLIKDGVKIINQNIYITSDEEIKEGDWCIDKYKVVFKQETDKIFSQFTGSKKIILTTDQDLIKDGVQAIDDEFLEWFVKNPSCEEVEVNKLCYGALSGFADAGYKIIIPKEEPTRCECGANVSCKCEPEKTMEEILSNLSLVNPVHLRMVSNGHGEFPDGYKLTEQGVKYILEKIGNK